MDKLRAGLGDEHWSKEEEAWLDDACLKRYLVARNMDVTKALAMLKATLVWRREFGVSELLRNPTDRVRTEAASGKMFVHGQDRSGRPIIVMRPRFENSKDTRGQMELLVYTLERAISQMKNGVGKMVILIDFKGLAMSNNPPLSTQKETLNILQNHYPERLGLALACSAPALFYGVFRVIKPFIDPNTNEKIQWAKNFSPGSPDMTMLEDLVAPDTLLSDYGGTSSFQYSNEAYFAEPFTPQYTLPL